jgi:hypothetical protein
VLATARMVRELMAVQSAPDSASAARAATAAARQMRRIGMTQPQIRQALEDAAEEQDKGYIAAALRAAIPPARPLAGDPAGQRAAGDSASDDSAAGDAAPADSAGSDTLAAEVLAADTFPADTLASLYVGAVHRGDSTRADLLRPKLASTLARDSLDGLSERVTELETERAALRQSAEDSKKSGLLGTLLGLLNDLGIGFGWTGLYFTAFTALWKGQTPGKKLFGIRVLRLDGLPLTLWASFERFGGYAAGLFTGLMGYAQVFWDRNRQAIQDKISETVVIRQPAGVALPTARPPLPPRPATLAPRPPPYPPPTRP